MVRARLLTWILSVYEDGFEALFSNPYFSVRRLSFESGCVKANTTVEDERNLFRMGSNNVKRLTIGHPIRDSLIVARLRWRYRKCKAGYCCR